MDDVSWGALAAALTVLGGLYTWFAYRRHGFAAGLRGAGFTILPAALWLTDTLELLGNVGSEIGGWVGDFVFSPAAWVGIVLAVLSVGCWVVAGVLAERGVGGAPAGAKKQQEQELPKTRGQQGGPVVSGDAEMDEIEALLRKRGIT